MERSDGRQEKENQEIKPLGRIYPKGFLGIDFYRLGNENFIHARFTS